MIYTKMKRTAKLFLNGRSQAVRLPAEFRFEGSEVLIEKDPATGNVTLSSKPRLSWETFLALRNQTDIPSQFMSKRGDGPPQKRDHFR
jgi:antitoxin VapB